MMQPDLEYGLKSEEYRSYLEGLATGNGIERGKSLARSSQESQNKKRQWLRQQQKPSSAVWCLVLMVGDVMLLMMALAAVVVLVSSLHLTFQISNGAFGIRNAKLIWICLALASWGFAVNMTQAQNPSFAASRFKSLCCILFALVLMNVFLMVLSYLFLNISLTTSAWLELFFIAFAIPLLATWRILLVEVMSSPHYRPRTVIVGVNLAGETIAKELQCAKHPVATILGYIGESTGESSCRNGLPILGGRDALRYLTYHRMIDMIIIALDNRADPELFKEAIEAAPLGISVLPMTAVFESSTGKVPVEHIGDQWYVVLQSERNLSPLYICWKKALDLVCGFCGLLVLCLAFPVIALLIYLDSPGPIFYSQERVGFRGKPFRIYKFRSMHNDAEAKGCAVWATKYDERATRVGRFLRATHVDELPQVLNILRGDMSLIGPRPERAEFVTELEKSIPLYRYRLAVKPGLTGWAQVKYHYARTDNDAVIKLQYDLYYIKRQTFMLDIFIILKTVFEVLSFRGS